MKPSGLHGLVAPESPRTEGGLTAVPGGFAPAPNPRDFLAADPDMRAMLPHVDAFRAGHSVASLAALAQALSDPADSGDKARLIGAMSQR